MVVYVWSKEEAIREKVLEYYKDVYINDRMGFQASMKLVISGLWLTYSKRLSLTDV